MSLFRPEPQEPQEPQSTASMLGNMLGIGPIMAALNDPAFQQHIRSLLQAVTETHARCAVLENKLDAIANELARIHGYQFGNGAGQVAPLPAQLDAAGVGGPTATGLAPDDGDRGNPTPPGSDSGDVRDTRPGGQAGSVRRTDAPMRIGGGLS